MNERNVSSIFVQSQAARAANVVHSAFGFRRLVQKQETAPLMVMNVIPLCSQQASNMQISYSFV